MNQVFSKIFDIEWFLLVPSPEKLGCFKKKRGILFFQHFELIFCVCEYFSILFTIKKDKIGKEKFFLILPIT